MARQQTGRGQEVQTSLVDAMVSILSLQADCIFTPARLPSAPAMTTGGVSLWNLQGLDGYINIAPAGQPMWERLAQAIGLKDLISDPKFVTNDVRRQNRKELNEIINRITSQKTMENGLNTSTGKEFPAGPSTTWHRPLKTPDQASGDDAELEQPTVKMKVLGFPVKMSETPARIRRPSPQLGEHSEEILKTLGIPRMRFEN